MFILLDTSLIENIENQNEQYMNDLMTILEEATICLRHKNHYISAKTSSLAKFFSDFALVNDKKTVANAFDYIYRKYNTLNSIIEKLNYVVIIGKYDKECDFLEKKFKVNYTYALKQHFWDETFLIPENIDDDKYIKRIVDYEKSKQNVFMLQNVEYKYRPEQGGGGKNIKQIFEKRLNEHAFVLSIIDTDKKNPNAEIGATAGCFEDDRDIVKYKNIFYYIPNIHEIENLFSSDDFMKLSSFSKNARNKIKEIENKNILQANLFRAFLDIKKGYTYGSVVQDNYLNDIFEVDYSSVNCSRGNCPCSGKKCNKSLLQGNSDYLSKIFNNSNLDYSFDNAANSLIPEIKVEWENIFHIVITTCCCNSDKVLGVN